MAKLSIQMTGVLLKSQPSIGLQAIISQCLSLSILMVLNYNIKYLNNENIITILSLTF